jgi:transposase
MGEQPPCIVAMEACARAHHWCHYVGLIPPAYVQSFVKRQKNDMADADAASRPIMGLSR